MMLSHLLGSLRLDDAVDIAGSLRFGGAVGTVWFTLLGGYLTSLWFTSDGWYSLSSMAHSGQLVLSDVVVRLTVVVLSTRMAHLPSLGAVP